MNLSKMDFTEKRVTGWGDAPAKSADAGSGEAKPAGKPKPEATGEKPAKKGKPAKK